ncbi:glycoprotein [Allosaccharopolyspora coralli]|uniref:Glycoprotein n=1 Tax=Allosaccharopolyspora coralli TaxID=2665642 RepID=A0A5Q3QF75_9PSEU|nr:DUF6049 family protein [Allosaccharopolyspora coralli]QGK71894.1 glycoprotein [Allosaccharopolyspora coralli]
MRFLSSVAVVLLTLALLPLTATTAAAQPGESRAQLEVTDITPSVVGPGAPGEVTISGRITNTGDRTITGLEARVQRGDAVDAPDDVQRALQDDVASATVPQFAPVTDTLAPQQQAPFEVRIPLAGGPSSLQIDRNGVYPLLVNINGEPQYGGRERIAEGRFLLPVTATPGNPPSPPPAATPTTLLVPLVDRPRMEREATPGQRTILADDQLSESLAPGGRLSDLVQAVGEEAGSGSPLAGGLCFAVDPDLIATASAMQDGYQVRQPDGSLQEGIGAGAAELWLGQLREVTQGRCVIPLPYADADVVALGRADLPDLIKGALDGADLIERELNVQTRRDVLWPIDGALGEPAASELGDFGIDTLLTQPSALGLSAEERAPVSVDTDNPEYRPTAQPIDPLLTAALDPQRAETGTAPAPAPGNGLLTAQDALGALTVRARTQTEPPAPSVLAPPRRWDLAAGDLRGLLGGLRQLTEQGFVRPAGLPSGPDGADGGSGSDEQAPPEQDGQPPEEGGQSPEQGGDGDREPAEPPGEQLPPARLNYPVLAGANEIRPALLQDLAALNYKVGDLFRSSERDPAIDVEPGVLTTPLRNGLLRAASSAWRGEPDAARTWLDTGESTLDGVLAGVQVDEFSGKVTLAASNSPIPLTVTNRLPVTVFVELKVARNPGLEVQDLGVLAIPAQGSRQFWPETETSRVGEFRVDVSVQTPSGTQLGSTRRLQLESNAYGPFTIVLTAGAGLLLVALAGRRIVRRVRNGRNTAEDGAGSAAPSSGSASDTPGRSENPGGTEQARDPDGKAPAWNAESRGAVGAWPGDPHHRQ